MVSKESKISSCSCCVCAFVTRLPYSLLLDFFMKFKMTSSCCCIFALITGISHNYRIVFVENTVELNITSIPPSLINHPLLSENMKFRVGNFRQQPSPPPPPMHAHNTIYFNKPIFPLKDHINYFT